MNLALLHPVCCYLLTQDRTRTEKALSSDKTKKKNRKILYNRALRIIKV